jgi:hypothetical protein
MRVAEWMESVHGLGPALGHHRLLSVGRLPLVICCIDDKQYFGWPHAADDDVSSKTMPRIGGTAGDAEVAKLQWHGDANGLAGADLTVRAEQRDDIGNELPAIVRAVPVLSGRERDDPADFPRLLFDGRMHDGHG